MNTSELRDGLEAQQVWIYFAAVIVATAIGFVIPGTAVLESAINPALALMLFVTFLQVPVAALGRALQELRFLGTLLAVNFIAVPLLVLGLMQFLPADPLIRLGVLMVLLCPCIDYVVTFAHLGRADARLLLASTPVLLIAQMALLPIYLRLFLGAEAAAYVQPGPFIHAFVWLIAIPFVLAALVQTWAARSKTGERVSSGLGLAPGAGHGLGALHRRRRGHAATRTDPRPDPECRAGLCRLLRAGAAHRMGRVAARTAAAGSRPRRRLQRGDPQLARGPAASPGRARRHPPGPGHHRHPDPDRAPGGVGLHPRHPRAGTSASLIRGS